MAASELPKYCEPRRFPGFVVEIEPRPATAALAGLELQRPEILECLPAVRAHRAGVRVTRRQDHRVEDRFGAARFAGLGQSAQLIRDRTARSLSTFAHVW